MKDFCGGQGRTRFHDEAYYKYVEEVEPRRTPTTAKRSIYKQKSFDFPIVYILIFVLASGRTIEAIRNNVEIAFETR